jgi:predicted ATPase
MSTGPEMRPVIRTPDQRLRVFVSSTLGELASERAAVRAVVERLRLTPVMFELGARPHPPRALYRTYLEQSHVFVALYWQSYGWVAPDETVSGLEDEYLLSLGMPKLLYVKEPAPERQDRLRELLRRIQDDDAATYKRFTSTEQLEHLLADDLMVLLSERFEATAGHAAAPASLDLVPPPRPLTALLGREDDVAVLSNLIAGGARLVTLTGTGGIGKTRLALEVGHRLTTAFDGAVHVVWLAGITAPSDVLPRIASSLGLPLDTGHGVLELLVRQLSDRRLLLILDNVEHVVAASADIAALLDRCPALHVLGTSRQPLRVRGEREYRVGPLPVPSPDDSLDVIRNSPAVRLFVDRARDVQPAFELTATNAPAIAAICRTVDGLPLALELAAARVRLLTPAMLLPRLTDHLDLLSGGPVDLPDRQRTLRATIDWSYQLLDEEERALFARLSVFYGGFTIDAEEQVCGDETADALQTLTSLLDKSLVVFGAGDADAEPRLLMLSAIRQYASERLDERGERARYRQRHADFFLELVDGYREDLLGATHAARSARLDAELENLRAAVSWWVERGNTSALGWWAWSTFPHYWLRGQLRDLDEMLDAAGHLLDPTSRDCRLGLTVRGLVHLERGRLEQGEALADRLLAESPPDDPSRPAVLVLKVAALIARGEVRPARDYGHRAYRAAVASGEAWLRALAARARGMAAYFAGQLTSARADFEECADYARRMGHWPMLAASLVPLGAVELREGNLERAHAFFVEATDSYRRGRSREGLPFLLEQVASMAAEADARLATAMLATAEGMRTEMGIVRLFPLEGPVAALRERLQTLLDKEYDSAWQSGTGLEALTALDRALQGPVVAPR